jgi:hypothetical protein
MPKPLEARYHRLHLHNEDIDGQTLLTVAGVVLCGCGSCGDELAEVVLTPFTFDSQLRWNVAVRRGYARVAPGTWRWSRHAQRSFRGAGHHAPKVQFRGEDGPGVEIVTARGDRIIRELNRVIVYRGTGGY